MSGSTAESPNRPGIIAIGGSAGSLGFLLSVGTMTEGRLTVPLLVVIHRMRNETNMLPEILGRRFGLPAKEAEEKEELQPGTIYVAPPDYHLLIEDDRTLALADMEVVNHCRPSIDVTFASVAEVYGRGAVGIVLSGANRDGTAGLAAIAQAGGRAIAQDPGEAEIQTMPRTALETVESCQVMGAQQLSAFLSTLCVRVTN